MLTMLADGPLFCQKEGKIWPVSPERDLPALPAGRVVVVVLQVGLVPLASGVLLVSAMLFALVRMRIVQAVPYPLCRVTRRCAPCQASQKQQGNLMVA
jgi:hypothetical protein